MIDSSKGFLTFLSDGTYNSTATPGGRNSRYLFLLMQGGFSMAYLPFPPVSSGLVPGYSHVFKPDADGSEPVPYPWVRTNTLHCGVFTAQNQLQRPQLLPPIARRNPNPQLPVRIRRISKDTCFLPQNLPLRFHSQDNLVSDQQFVGKSMRDGK